MQKSKKYYLAMVFLLIFHSSVFANQNCKAKIDLRKIISIESNGNPKAYNRKNNDRGLCQITPILLKEYNNFHKVKYTEADLFNAEINKQIAIWYLEIRIPQMLKHFHLAITKRNIIICYNAGISYLVSNKRIPKVTEWYLREYRASQNSFF